MNETAATWRSSPFAREAYALQANGAHRDHSDTGSVQFAEANKELTGSWTTSADSSPSRRDTPLANRIHTMDEALAASVAKDWDVNALPGEYPLDFDTETGAFRQVSRLALPSVAAS